MSFPSRFARHVGDPGGVSATYRPALFSRFNRRERLAALALKFAYGLSMPKGSSISTFNNTCLPAFEIDSRYGKTLSGCFILAHRYTQKITCTHDC